MTSRSRFPRAGLLSASLLAGLLAVPFLGAAAQADDATPARPAGASYAEPGANVPAAIDPALIDPASLVHAGDPQPADPQAQAEQALATVQQIIDPTVQTVTADDGTDLSVALASLATQQHNLPKSLQDDAARLLARPNPNDPTTGGIECQPNSGLPCYGTTPEAPSVCDAGICVHYVASGPNAAGGSYPAQVLGVMKNVAAKYVTAGYRKPLPDGTVGTSSGGVGNGPGVFDVYLADLGHLGLYGYCTTDKRVPGHGTAAAYCVLDNNYTEKVFQGQQPIENLEVTAAHEYFHAVQFAYDVGEAAWFMEGTATWAEDELYTDINDNRQFLSSGPLGRPAQSLTNNAGVYGSWIFFRFLTERYPALNAPGGLPVIIRDLWSRAAGGPTARQALNRTLAARHTDLRSQFGWFATWNRRPAAYYSEGSAYRAAPLWRKFKITNARRSASARTDINSLASRSVRFTSGLTRGRLRVNINVNSLASGGFATVTIKQKGKAAVATKVRLNAQGDKRATYAFGRKVQWVEITLSNSGTQRRVAKISARVVR